MKLQISHYGFTVIYHIKFYDLVYLISRTKPAKEYSIMKHHAFVLIISVCIIVHGCETTQEQDAISENPSFGLIEPNQIIKASPPVTKEVDNNIIPSIKPTGNRIKAKKPSKISNLFDKKKVPNPIKKKLNINNAFVVTPGLDNIPLPTTHEVPESGYVIMDKDTIFAAESRIIKQPLPITALPMRFKDAATHNIQYLDVQQGMPSSFVYSILEDRRGNIWFGTYGGGMCRYDGRTFYSFTDKDGLSNNRVRSIIEDRNGNIWIGTNGGGLHKYDGNRTFIYNTKQGIDNNVIMSLLEDNQGNIWIGTSGGALSKFDGTSFTHYKDGLNNSIRAMTQDSQGNIWLATGGGGVIKFDGKSFLTIDNNLGLPHNDVRSVLEDAKGDLWIGTNGGGIIKFDGTFLYNYRESDGLTNDKILSMYQDHSGNIWCGTYGGGVSKFDGQSFTSYTGKEGLSNNTIMSINQDKVGNLWFGTNGGGVSKFNEQSFVNYTNIDKLSDNVVRSILQDKKGNLWFGIDGSGLAKYDGESFSLYTSNEGLRNNSVYTILNDKDNNIWIATRGTGVAKFDGEYFTYYTVEDGLGNNNIRTMLEDRDGNIWFGSYGNGVSKFDGKVFKTYSRKDGLGQNVIRSIYEDQKGNIWIGTDGGGVSKFDGHSFSTYSTKHGLSNNTVMSIYEDSNENIWLGTWGGGACMFDGNQFYTYTTSNGLTHNFALSITEDDSNNIWVGTEGGINVFAPMDISGYDGSGKFRHRTFVKSDGLKRMDLALNAVCIDNSRKIWWGIGKGMTMLDLNKFKQIASKPQIQLNNIEIEQQFIDYRNLTDSAYSSSISFGDQILESENSIISFYNYPSKLNLPFNLNHLTFNFSAIDWSAPHKIEYQFFLDGLDKKWSILDKDNKAEYRNLSYGNYTFKVQAIGAGNQWSEIFEYPLTIRPPWYHTWWARTSAIIIILGTIIVIYNSVQNYTINLQRRLQEKKQFIDITADQNKRLRDFSFMTSHNIRSSVTNLIGLIDLIHHDPGNDEYVKMLHKATDKLDITLQNISELLNFENEISVLKKIDCKVSESIHRTLTLNSQVIDNKNIIINDQINEDITVKAIPAYLDSILNNLITNAIKYGTTDESKTIDITAQSFDSMTIISVQDYGLGIDLKKYNDKLFKLGSRFHASQSDGQGLGLFMSKHQMEGMNGKIEVESEINMGTTVRVYFSQN